MERRKFIRNSFWTLGGLMIGGAGIFRFLHNKEPKEYPFPPTIETIHQGKGKNILVLMSAGTRNGNTDRLTDSFIQGLVEKDHTVMKVYLGSMKMAGCRGCGACQRNGNRCVVQDDMQKIYPLFAACDTLVMASPLYFGTITARLKAFVERLYAISKEDKYPEKDTVLLMTAGDDKADTFDHALGYFHVISGVFGNHEVETYCAGGCTGCEKTARNIDMKHLENAYQMGLNI